MLTKTKTPPGPSKWLIEGLMGPIGQNPLQFFQKLAQEYGPMVYFHMGPQPVLLLTEPALIQQVLVKDNALFIKGRVLEIAKDLFGEGLLTSEGEHHARQRRLIQPLFYRQMIRQYAQMMVNYGDAFRERWTEGQSFDLAEEMMKLTLVIVGKTLFDTDVEKQAPHVGEAMQTIISGFNLIGRPIAMMTRNVPTPKRARYLAAKAVLDKTILEIIEKHRHDDAQTPNLIATLMHVKDHQGDGQAMNDQQIRDEAVTLFLAGHETTANALSWTWYLLSQHPRVEAKLHQELDDVLSGRLPTFEDLNQLSYTRLVLMESMRLYPPAWAIARRPLSDYQLTEDYRVPKGAAIIMSQYIVQRDPRYYLDPDRFWPERWESNLKNNNPKFAYFPFSGGPRNCIGEAFAWMEGTLLIATLAQKWKFRLVSGHPVEPEPLITLRPKYGLKMLCQPR